MECWRSSQPLPCDLFFDEFTDLLERTTIYSIVLLTGYVNIHLDSTSCLSSVKFISIRLGRGFWQQVTNSTRKTGHLQTFCMLPHLVWKQQLPKWHSDQCFISMSAAFSTTKRRRQPTIRRHGRLTDIDPWEIRFRDLPCHPQANNKQMVTDERKMSM
jgi:hypothetical protein